MRLNVRQHTASLQTWIWAPTFVWTSYSSQIDKIYKTIFITWFDWLICDVCVNVYIISKNNNKRTSRTKITMTTTTPVSEAKAKAGKRRRKWAETDGQTEIDGKKLWKRTEIHVGYGTAKIISTLENKKIQKKWERQQRKAQKTRAPKEGPGHVLQKQMKN